MILGKYVVPRKKNEYLSLVARVYGVEEVREALEFYGEWVEGEGVAEVLRV